MELTTATPQDIDTQLAALDHAYSKLIRDRAARVDFLHALDGQRKVSQGRRRVYLTNEPDTIASLLVKLDRNRTNPGVLIQPESVRESFARIEQLDADMITNRTACEPYDEEYNRRPWQRFFQVTGGHIHAGRWCVGGSIRWSTDIGWRPELSAKDEAAAVAQLGPNLCTKCFRSAPVEFTHKARR